MKTALKKYLIPILLVFSVIVSICVVLYMSRFDFNNRIEFDKISIFNNGWIDVNKNAAIDSDKNIIKNNGSLPIHIKNTLPSNLSLIHI